MSFETFDGREFSIFEKRKETKMRQKYSAITAFCIQCLGYSKVKVHENKQEYFTCNSHEMLIY